jgi:hypothetical protein
MKLFTILSIASLATVLTSFVCAADNELSDQEKKDGWKLLFDGKTTEGWRGYKKADVPADWKVIDGTLAQTGKGGDLRTLDKYENFELLIDWKFETDGNSGIIYHCSEEGGAPYETGPEMQVMIHPPEKVPGKNDGGSYYDVVAPTKIATKGKGEWNTYKIVCNGSKVEHWVNGEKVVDVDTGTDEFKAKIAASKWGKVKLFNTVKNGYIDLQDHGSKIAFKNIKIKVLPETK